MAEHVFRFFGVALKESEDWTAQSFFTPRSTFFVGQKAFVEDFFPRPRQAK